MENWQRSSLHTALSLSTVERPIAAQPPVTHLFRAVFYRAVACPPAVTCISPAALRETTVCALQRELPLARNYMCFEVYALVYLLSRRRAWNRFPGC